MCDITCCQNFCICCFTAPWTFCIPLDNSRFESCNKVQGKWNGTEGELWRVSSRFFIQSRWKVNDIIKNRSKSFTEAQTTAFWDRHESDKNRRLGDVTVQDLQEGCLYRRFCKKKIKKMDRYKRKTLVKDRERLGSAHLDLTSVKPFRLSFCLVTKTNKKQLMICSTRAE